MNRWMVVRMSLAMVIALAAPTGAQEPVPMLAPGEALLQVSGTGRVLAVPDQATVETGVTADGPTSDRALAANAAVAERLVAALRAAGVPEKNIRTAAVRVGPRYRPARSERQ